MKINNKIINTNEVLSHFSKKDINVIGEIEFDIEEEINNYIKKINEVLQTNTGLCQTL